jgi:hypothetical protein
MIPTSFTSAAAIRSVGWWTAYLPQHKYREQRRSVHQATSETVEIPRGRLPAEYGDRTYGVLNVVTRSG